jgi:hypothetical protein
MKMTTRMMTTVIAVVALAMMTGACRGGPYEPEYLEGDAAVRQNQPFTPHSIGR